jgi:hypothetical protein
MAHLNLRMKIVQEEKLKSTLCEIVKTEDGNDSHAHLEAATGREEASS